MGAVAAAFWQSWGQIGWAIGTGLRARGRQFYGVGSRFRLQGLGCAHLEIKDRLHGLILIKLVLGRWGKKINVQRQEGRVGWVLHF